MNIEKRKKISKQKNAAIFLIVGPLVYLLYFLFERADVEKYGTTNYVLCGGLITLIICGTVGLKNSLRKLRELKD